MTNIKILTTQRQQLVKLKRIISHCNNKIAGTDYEIQERLLIYNDLIDERINIILTAIKNPQNLAHAKYVINCTQNEIQQALNDLDKIDKKLN